MSETDAIEDVARNLVEKVAKNYLFEFLDDSMYPFEKDANDILKENNINDIKVICNEYTQDSEKENVMCYLIIFNTLPNFSWQENYIIG